MKANELDRTKTGTGENGPQTRNWKAEIGFTRLEIGFTRTETGGFSLLLWRRGSENYFQESEWIGEQIVL